MKSTLTAAAALLMVAGLAACGDGEDAGSGSGSDEPIILGSVNALSGPATFPEASAAAQAVFDRVNADGGINGRTIEYKITDDKADPATATQLARELVTSDEAVALVGGASLVDCDVNGAYYEQQEIMSVVGTGVGPGCFSSPVMAPVNAGPFLDSQMTLTYGSEELGLENICGFLAITGATLPAYQEAIDAWTEETGNELSYLDDTVPYGNPDFTPQAVKIKEEGCDAVFTNFVEPDALGLLNAAVAQQVTGVTWLFLTSVYSEPFAEAAPAGQQVYVPAEFLPFTDESAEANQDWRDLMTENDLALTSFSQGGYLAATYLVEVLETIEGDVTRESVTEALRTMEPIENEMVGTPYVFGDGDTHNPNHAGFPVVLDDGAWTNAADDWLVVDQG
jgi:branched-chain amino acid transport system substrate-binding protein